MTPASAANVPPGCTNDTIPITTNATASSAYATRHQPVEVKIPIPSVAPAPSITMPNRIEIADTVVQSKRNTITENSSQQAAVTSFSHQKRAASVATRSSRGVADVALTALSVEVARVRLDHPRRVNRTERDDAQGEGKRTSSRCVRLSPNCAARSMLDHAGARCMTRME